ncbi:dTDP-glucose 4,6-dehydratase [Helicobacter fennelliae MRY12-0050]|uniref:dTDP-glucose 4,6-dehydratase n=1 Tax=Helicobacter fennelliae MRY12-0050 TaxID=1325130 RepID=T1DVP9_9HELI|nr:dTDP-glucose 4,6-dehydratase [Helicobacter fennelliae MRY12-0050]STQ84363.1 NAD-dependent epimerase/dehydratase [Helicobacter fennelliae]
MSGGGQIQESISYNKLLQSNIYPNYKFIKLQLEDTQNLAYLFKTQEFDVVCNLAAQAGVRYSLKSPRAYIDSNIIGFLNILESCRHNNVKHLVYASSSSVYGLNQDMPFSTHKSADHPISLYATSKKSNELMAHTYSHLFHLPTTGLRFFTVYGPWGRPDMALFQFTKNILENKSIDVFNEGNMARDFTYIDDIVEGVVRVIDNVPKPNPKWDTHKADSSSSSAPYKIYNIGNSAPVKLMDFIAEIENNIGKKAKKNFLPLQEGDVLATFADVSDLQNDLFYQPSTSISTGIAHFVRWYREYYKC